jgi:ribosomal protein S19
MFLIGKIVQVHNGKSFQKVTVTRDKVGFKFGSFVSTRKFIKKTKSNKKK